ncbi:hypothetical protein WME79_24410 [Sorangium sp. So ce726]|uniref:hypothetical protein n=1 Tax=Sorangium sp. So ce726 TaxID=3133319 RepID=UPI003F5F5F4E
MNHWGVLDFDGPGGGVLSTSTTAGFVAKFDHGGSHIWSKSFDEVHVVSVAADGEDNVYIAGYTSQDVDFGGGTLSVGDGTALFVVKLDSDGDHVWSKVYGGVDVFDSAGVNSIAVDSAGDVYIAGYYSYYLTIGLDTSWADTLDAFLVKLDGADGSPVFGKFFGVPYGTMAASFGVAVDPDDSVVVSGTYSGTVNFGGSSFTANSGGPWIIDFNKGDAFLAKFESDGDHLWSNSFGDDDYAGANEVAIDGAGNIVVIGDFGGSVDFGSNTATLTDPWSSDMNVFLAQFSAAGVDQWSDGYGGTGWDEGRGVAVDSAGNVSVVVASSGAVNFGGSTLTSAGNMDIFVAHFDDAGAHDWSNNYGDSSYQVADAIALDSSGNATIAGSLIGSANFGGSTLTSAVGGYSDVVLVQFEP